MLTKININSWCKFVINCRYFNTSQSSCYIQKYRKQRKLPLNPNACGVLIDTPDYSFLDGRLTPLTQGQKQRLNRQREIKSKIIELTGEMDFAVDRYNRQLAEEEQRKKDKIASKLKPKGEALLKSK